MSDTTAPQGAVKARAESAGNAPTASPAIAGEVESEGAAQQPRGHEVCTTVFPELAFKQKEEKKTTCSFCGGPCEGEYHHVCAEAYGLDYDPKSEQDAKDFLERRTKLLNDFANNTGAFAKVAHCSRCGRKLKDPNATIGPTCAKKVAGSGGQ